MTARDYKESLAQRLRDAGFDFEHPDPALAWVVFKTSTAEKVDCEDSYLFWEAASDFFDFVREFRYRSEEDAVWHEQVTVSFAPVSLPLDLQPVAVFSRDYENDESFFHAVESHAEFRRGLSCRQWSVDLRIDGV